MKLEQSFEVQAPIDVVWHALNDLERVAPCLPGATITGHDDDGTYHGEFKVKLGPTTAAYRGTIRIQDADESTHTATLVAKGADKRGQGGANATIVNTLVDTGGATRVDAVTDFSITGRLARFGRGAGGAGAAGRRRGDGDRAAGDAHERTPGHRQARQRDQPVLLGAPGAHQADLRPLAAAPEEPLMSDDCGVCAGDAPPLIGSVLTGTGLTLAQAAARLERGEPLPALTEVQRRIVERYATEVSRA